MICCSSLILSVTPLRGKALRGEHLIATLASETPNQSAPTFRIRPDIRATLYGSRQPPCSLCSIYQRLMLSFGTSIQRSRLPSARIVFSWALGARTTVLSCIHDLVTSPNYSLTLPPLLLTHVPLLSHLPSSLTSCNRLISRVTQQCIGQS
jgi:hypothetical protein